MCSDFLFVLYPTHFAEMYAIFSLTRLCRNYSGYRELRLGRRDASFNKFSIDAFCNFAEVWQSRDLYKLPALASRDRSTLSEWIV